MGGYSLRPETMGPGPQAMANRPQSINNRPKATEQNPQSMDPTKLLEEVDSHKVSPAAAGALRL